MRITSLGYNPANQTTNYKNKQQNPAFASYVAVIEKKAGTASKADCLCAVSILKENILERAIGTLLPEYHPKMNLEEGERVLAVVQIPSGYDRQYREHFDCINCSGLSFNINNQFRFALIPGA